MSIHVHIYIKNPLRRTSDHIAITYLQTFSALGEDAFGALAFASLATTRICALLHKIVSV